MMRLHFYRDRTGHFRWTLFAQNGRKLANAGEGYEREATCRRIAYRLFSALLATGDDARKVKR